MSFCRAAGIAGVFAIAAMRLAAAGSTPANTGKAPAQSGAPVQTQTLRVRDDYILQPLDVIKVEVFQETNLERKVPISQDFMVSLPLIGTVNLKGKTVHEAQEIIRVLYDRDYLVNPQVNVTVVEFSKHNVTVLGNVDKAGSVAIPSDKPLKLLEAIALAGGFTRLANKSRVTLTRQSADGKNETSEINVDNIIQSKNANDVILKEGDIIYVPERIL